MEEAYELKVALVQIESPDTETKRDRVKRVGELLEAASGADIVILPELWNVGFFSFDRYARDAEPLHGETVELMREKARQLRAHILMGSFVEESETGLHNTALLISDRGEIVASYRKMHLFGYDSRENQLLTPGDRIVVAKTRFGRLGIATCYDLRFPEMYRAMVDQGVVCFLVAAAWPEARLDHWRLFTRTRALENQSFLVACNACGVSGGVRLAGHSCVVDPWGVPVATADGHESVLTVEIDLSEATRIRERFPALQDRRADSVYQVYG